MQDVFWYIKEAIDAYFAGRPFHVAVKAGCVVGKKPDRQALDRSLAERRAAAVGAGAAAKVAVTAAVPRTAAADTEEDSRFDELETVLPWSPQAIARGSVRAVEPDDAEVPELAAAEFSLDEDSLGEQAIDAFIEGRKRPHHLAD